MEIELVQLREQLDQQQPNSFQDTLTIFRREQEDILNTRLREFQQDRSSHSRQLDYLQGEVKQLRSDRDRGKAEIAALREELLERDRTLLSLQESLKTRCSLPTVTPQSQTIPTQTRPAPAQPPHSLSHGSSPHLTQPAPATTMLPPQHQWILHTPLRLHRHTEAEGLKLSCSWTPTEGF